MDSHNAADAHTRAASKYVSVNGLRLHYFDWGGNTARIFVLCHGGSAHAHWWDAVAPALAAVAMHMRTTTGARPHLRFTPSPGSRFTRLSRYVMLECTANRTRSLIQAADGDFTGRPVVHLDG